MEFGFSVVAGPLTQISVSLSGLKDVVTAAKYTKKLYDSYTGREQVVLLQQSLASSKVSIPATSTFDSLAYLESRQKYANTSGVARRSSNALCRVLLQGTSTSTHGHPGLLCLRALTTALLCFLREDTIASVYQDVLPKYLLHCEQEGEAFIFEGPSLLSLKQYIHSIAEEEEGDEYRRYLLHHVDSQVQRVTLSASTLTDLLASEFLEIGHINGLLRWVLTPVLKREASIYRTRSLKIWCIALVLSKVAFEVEANCDAITTTPGDHVEDLVLHHFAGKPEVVLVLASGWPTDIGWQSGKRDDEPVYVPVEIPPRPISVRAFPATAKLGDAISSRHAKDVSRLEEAFRGSYLFVRQQLSQDPRIRLVAGLQGPLADDSSISVVPLSTESLPTTEDLKLLRSFQAVFDPQIQWPKGMINDTVIPLMVPLLMRYLLPWHEQHNNLADGIGQSSQLMLNYIVFASMLAAVSLFVRSSECQTDESGLDMQFVYQHPHWGTSSGISGLATSFTGVMSFLSHARSEDLGGDLCYAWKGLVLEILLGMQWRETAARSGNNHYQSRLTWGAQKAGLTVVNDFILEPMAKDLSASYTYVSFLGRLIDIPTEDGCIVGYNPYPKTMGDSQYRPLMNREAIITALLEPVPSSKDALRLDLEPCCEDDPDKCSFVLRTGGLPKSQVAIDQFHNANTHQRRTPSNESNQFCFTYCARAPGPSCPAPETILRYLFHPHDQWFELPLLRLIETAKFGQILCCPTSSSNKTSGRWIVQTHDNELLLRLALMCRLPERLGGKPQKIVTDCLGAGLSAIAINGPCSMIILHRQFHNRLLDPPEQGYDSRNDLLETAAHHLWLNKKLYSNPEEPSFWSISRFIWQPPDYGDNHGYPDIIVNRLARHPYIDDHDMFLVLHVVDLDSIIDYKLDVAANKAAIAKRMDQAIKLWVKEHGRTTY